CVYAAEYTACYRHITLLIAKSLNSQIRASGCLGMTSSLGLRTSLVAIALVASVAVGLGASYYFASAENSFVVTWSQNPLMIKFSARSSTSGSASDSFTCSHATAPVNLNAQTSAPDTITLSVSPSAFPACNSTPDNVVVTASCTASATD